MYVDILYPKWDNTVPGDGNKRDPDMDWIGCLGSNGQHSTILPFRVTFIVVTRYMYYFWGQYYRIASKTLAIFCLNQFIIIFSRPSAMHCFFVSLDQRNEFDLSLFRRGLSAIARKAGKSTMARERPAWVLLWRGSWCTHPWRRNHHPLLCLDLWVHTAKSSSAARDQRLAPQNGGRVKQYEGYHYVHAPRPRDSY